MAVNERFKPDCDPGPGRHRKLRLKIDQETFDSLVERVLVIGNTTPDEAIAVMCLDALAQVALAGFGNATAPIPKD